MEHKKIHTYFYISEHSASFSLIEEKKYFWSGKLFQCTIKPRINIIFDILESSDESSSAQDKRRNLSSIEISTSGSQVGL